MNKNNIRILTTLVLVGLLFLPLTASAGIITASAGIITDYWLNQTLGDMASDMFDALTSVIFTLIANLVAGIPSAALDFLNWVAGPGFLKVSMTGDDNPIVTEGWDITRNLANVALIFGLIIIAINIIIGNAEVQAKKALINFFLIAVLINFTPLICGIIIDASNALTNYFLQEGIKKDLVNFLAQAMADSGGFDFTALIVFFLFGIFSAVIYLLYALIFVCRYFILWILIILSPLAFASKVFPRSRIITKLFPSFFYWDEWWDMFIQWNVIGIPAGFFIYLSNMAMTEMAAGGFFASAEGISIFGKLFTYAMPFIFMAIGFMVTISSGGKVTGIIGGYGKKIWSKGKTAAVAGTTGAALGFASGAVAGARSEASLGALRGSLKGAAQGALTGGKSEKAQAKRWVQRNVKERLGITQQGATTEEEKKEIEGITGKFKNLETTDLQRIAQQTGTTEKNHKEKIAAILALIDKGEDVRPEEINWVINNRASLQRRGADLNKIAEYAPELSQQITNRTTQQTLGGMSTKKYQETVRAGSLNNFDVFVNSNSKQIKKTLDEGSTQQQNNIKSWLTNPQRRQQVIAERDRLSYELNNYRSPMPGVPIISPEEATEAERRLDNINKIIVEIDNSIR